MSEKEDKYVLRTEWIQNTGKIYEKINENDRKHLEAYNSLNSKIERQTGLQEKQFESQERQEKLLEKISGVVERFGDEFKDVQYTVRSHDTQLEQINKSILEKQKGNVQVVVALIGGGTSIIAAAVGLAKILF
ncbi:conserved hypothetical protein [Staphylococcus capitis]|nr:hypothetical protein [Staphylococcus capitis]CQD26422.1 conserved hypothetical protein [Staphylococcus capitis]